MLSRGRRLTLRATTRGYPYGAMSPLAIRRAARRLRRHAAGVLVVLALGAIVALHHSGMAAGDMHHSGMGMVVELCLGVFTAVGATVAAIAIGLRSLGRWRPRRVLPAGARIVSRHQTVEPRAGPPPQPFLCVWRR